MTDRRDDLPPPGPAPVGGWGSVSDADRAAMRRLGESLEELDYAHANSEIALALAAAERGEVVGVKLSPDTVRRLAALCDPEPGFPVTLSDAVGGVIWQAYLASRQTADPDPEASP